MMPGRGDGVLQRGVRRHAGRGRVEGRMRRPDLLVEPLVGERLIHGSVSVRS